MTDWADTKLVQDAQTLFRVISGRWTLPMLAALQRGPRRHGELRRAIAPIQPKVFNQTLRRLTDQRLVTRDVGAGTPPAVFYGLSPAARSLMDELGSLLDWADKNPQLLRHWRETT